MWVRGCVVVTHEPNQVRIRFWIAFSFNEWLQFMLCFCACNKSNHEYHLTLTHSFFFYCSMMVGHESLWLRLVF